MSRAERSVMITAAAVGVAGVVPWSLGGYYPNADWLFPLGAMLFMLAVGIMTGGLIALSIAHMERLDKINDEMAAARAERERRDIVTTPQQRGAS